MIRFFVRLAIAALADWFMWQISTPEMRFERKTRKHRRALLAAIDAAAPVVEEFYRVMQRAAHELVVWAEGVNLLECEEE